MAAKMEQRTEVLMLRHDGWKQREIAETVGCHQSTVSRILRKWKSGDGILPGISSGKPRKMTNREERNLGKIVKRRPELTHNQVAKTFELEIGKKFPEVQ